MLLLPFSAQVDFSNEPASGSRSFRALDVEIDDLSFLWPIGGSPEAVEIDVHCTKQLSRNG